VGHDHPPAAPTRATGHRQGHRSTRHHIVVIASEHIGHDGCGCLLSRPSPKSTGKIQLGSRNVTILIRNLNSFGPTSTFNRIAGEQLGGFRSRIYARRVHRNIAISADASMIASAFIV
jgi:hypothetical protein